MNISKEQVAKFLGESWAEHLTEEFHKEYMGILSRYLQNDRKYYNVYPPKSQVFRAYQLTPYHEVKTVILGQDPYHTPGVANGLAFSYNNKLGSSLPPSLNNIFTEVEKDTGNYLDSNNGDLTKWATQGVFLLNTVLTVKEGLPKSHRGFGWERFTGKTVRVLSERDDPVVFMLWGKDAKEQKGNIDQSKHYILEASHPSPFSYRISFKDCAHFHQANLILKELGKEPIQW